MKLENRIYYAEEAGSYYMRFVGDVRVTFCGALTNYLERLFSVEEIYSVVVDLRSAKAVDSTTLGLLAKLALYLKKTRELTPVLLVEDESMTRLLESMGIDEIFKLTAKLPKDIGQEKELACSAVGEEEAREKVLEAHKTLMGLNNKNMLVFSDLVKSLEKESPN
ncbi:MAG: anti-anti-sigma factor [Porticoccaceae bacterium]|nr:anti-anti-sigma factor [Porticoccaceae bacterium]